MLATTRKPASKPRARATKPKTDRRTGEADRRHVWGLAPDGIERRVGPEDRRSGVPAEPIKSRSRKPAAEPERWAGGERVDAGGGRIPTE